MKIAFVTDGGFKLGMGHIVRTITIAGELRDKAEITFLTKSGHTVINEINGAGFNVRKAVNDTHLLKLLQQIKPDIVIIDKSEVDASFAKKIKDSLTTKLVIFENTSAANRRADIVVNAVLGSQFKNSRFIDGKTNTQYFYGPRYWVLRKEFDDFRNIPKTPPNKADSILLTFGGSDPLNLTSKVLDLLLAQPEDYKIDVILGIHFNYVDELNRVLVKYASKKDKVNIYRNINNIAELMYRADLVITSPGLSVFEALRVGTSVIALHQNSWQKDSFKGFVKTLDKTEVARLTDMIARADFINLQKENILKLDIGEGKKEVLEAIVGG